MSAPRPNVVSRFLTDRGFARSTRYTSRIPGLPIITAGFEVGAQDGVTTVTYTLGTGAPSMTLERRRELVSAVVYGMERALSERYTVIMFEPTVGVAYRLTVEG